MKKILSLLLIIVCVVFCLTGCGIGSYIEKGGSVSTPDVPDDPGGEGPETPTVPDTHYTVSVFFGSEMFKPGDTDITVVWRNDSRIERKLLSADGTADAGELDGDFSVYLEGLPERYTYDSCGYVATSDMRKVSILLTSVQPPVIGDGKGLYISQGCYRVVYDGIYRAVITSKNQVLYYEYQPQAAGVYSIESLVNVYDGEINPYVDVYGGTHANKFKLRTVTDGGHAVDGSFTKNFRCEYRIDSTEISSTFSFAVGAESKSGKYPISVDFRIRYEGEYSNANSDVRIKRAQEAYTTAADPKPGETYHYADMDTKVFDASKFKYNNNTGWYHYYSEELFADDPYGYGSGYGPVLCCAITKAMPAYPLTTLYNANFVGLGQNFLRLYEIWIEEEQKFAAFDYTSFIREDYKRVCNRDGVCYVTKELKEFLQVFAENHSLYTDGIGAGDNTPEALGYSANQDALWLFACGFYL